jgi:hypothetical protein
VTAREWLDAVEARANAATEGPWVVETPESVYGHDGGPDWAELRWVSDEATVADDDPPWIGPVGTADAEFIAHARTDVPALVAALRAVLDLAVERGDHDPTEWVHVRDIRNTIDTHLGGVS